MWPPIYALIIFLELSCGNNIHGDRDRDFQNQDSLTVKLLRYLVGIVQKTTGTQQRDQKQLTLTLSFNEL